MIQNSKSIVGLFQHRLRLDPRMFGHPNGRGRSWRICYRSRNKRWNCPYSLADLAQKLLAPMSCNLELNHSAYLLAPNSMLQVQAQHLKAFRKVLPGKNVYDLSQNPEFRKRTENTDGALPCLTTSAALWCLDWNSTQ